MRIRSEIFGAMEVIEVKITGEAGEEISSASPSAPCELKKRPENLYGRFRENPAAQPPLQGNDIDTCTSSSPKNNLSVALAFVAYPFKKNLDGKFEQFIHTPTTPSSDPRLQRDASFLSLKLNTSDNNVSVSIKRDQGPKKDHIQASDKAKSLEAQPLQEGSAITLLAPELSKTLRSERRMRSGISSERRMKSGINGVRRRNMQELVDLNKRISNFSMNSTQSTFTAGLSSSSRVSVLTGSPLHPLEKRSFKR